MSYPVLLYVEDDEMNREVMEIFLRDVMGLDQPGQLVIYPDSRDFAAKVAALDPHPDLILLDIMMEPHSGIECLGMIRQLPSYHKTPVVAITASVMNDEIHRLQIAGFNGCIAKPFQPEKFVPAMQALLDGQEVWMIR
jgi:two-component system cell cycle response regulator DivK